MTDTAALDALAGWLDILRKANTEKARAEEVIATARGHIEAALGEAEVGTVAGVPVVTWKHTTSTRLDQGKVKTFLDDAGYDLADFQTTSTTRRFVPLDAS